MVEYRVLIATMTVFPSHSLSGQYHILPHGENLDEKSSEILDNKFYFVSFLFLMDSVCLKY